VFACSAFWSATVSSDIITGEIKFNKKAPFSGVLFVKQNESGSAEASMDQLDKQFTKKVSVGAPDSKVTFKNGDDFDHNIFANDLANKISFDIGLMPSGQTSELKMDWLPDTIVRIGCKIHPKMRSYIANVNSDYYQAFEFQKKIKTYPVNILEVPAHNRDIVLMIPKYEQLTLNLMQGESKTVDIVKKGKVKGTLTLSRQ